MFFILVHLRFFVGVRHDFAKVYLKTKKMTDISQTQNPAVFVEID